MYEVIILTFNFSKSCWFFGWTKTYSLLTIDGDFVLPTHYGLVSTYSEIYLGLHCRRQWLAALGYQAINKQRHIQVIPHTRHADLWLCGNMVSVILIAKAKTTRNRCLSYCKYIHIYDQTVIYYNSLIAVCTILPPLVIFYIAINTLIISFEHSVPGHHSLQVVIAGLWHFPYRGGRYGTNAISRGCVMTVQWMVISKRWPVIYGWSIS